MKYFKGTLLISYILWNKLLFKEVPYLITFFRKKYAQDFKIYLCNCSLNITIYSGIATFNMTLDPYLNQTFLQEHLILMQLPWHLNTLCNMFLGLWSVVCIKIFTN